MRLLFIGSLRHLFIFCTNSIIKEAYPSKNGERAHRDAILPKKGLIFLLSSLAAKLLRRDIINEELGTRNDSFSS